MAEIGRAWYDDFGSDVDAVAPQIYWPDFGWSVEEAVAYIREYAWPRPVIPTVPLTAPPEEVAHFVSELAGVVRSFILWRWHSGYPESIVAAAASFRPPDLVEPTGPGLDTPEGAAAYAGLTGIYNGATGTAGVLPSAPDQADLSAIIERMQRIKARHGYAP